MSFCAYLLVNKIFIAQARKLIDFLLRATKSNNLRFNDKKIKISNRYFNNKFFSSIIFIARFFLNNLFHHSEKIILMITQPSSIIYTINEQDVEINQDGRYRWQFIILTKKQIIEETTKST
ncbi:hypothetical protein C6P54_10175 [Enterococcus mundtii]|nr:hypothetical protein C6P54_10175 [Enterococcus mundtii]